MTDLAWALLAATLVIAALDWVAKAIGSKPMEYVFKPLTMVALIGVALALDPSDAGARAAFVVALVFGMAGDVFLMLPDDKRWFVFGLASFLVGHLAYVVGLVLLGLSVGALVVGLVVVLVAMAVIGRRIVAAVRSGDEPALAAPVSVYMGVISVMVVGAFGTTLPVAIGGSLLFFASDACIGWSRFVRPHAWMELFIIVTYHLGQIGLVLALTA
ncbi:MAG: lysoplasmalogenase [Acidimicrobiales bacterium]|nr:lysoplasmalogenase [Acidimicrobiales bacterium]MCB9373200.1 lysoplasmalogenase [Microthrixaceae bacterium]